MTKVSPPDLTSSAVAATSPGSRPARIDAAFLLLCTVGAFLLRWQFAMSSGLWRDEAWCIAITHLPTVHDVIIFLQHHESHPPLFYLLMRGWMRLAGDSDARLLLLPVLLGAAIVPVVFATARPVFGRTAAMAAAVFVTLSGTLAQGAGLARPYSLLPLLVLLSTYLLWRLIYGPVAPGAGPWCVRTGASWAAVTTAMAYTHNWGMLILAAEWGVVVLSALFSRSAWSAAAPLRWTRPPKRVITEWIAVNAAFLLLYGWWAPTLLYQSHHAGYEPGQGVGFWAPVVQLISIGLPLPYNYSVLAYALAAAVPAAMTVIVATRRRASPTAGGPRRLAATAVSSAAAPASSGLLVFAGVPVLAFGTAVALSHQTGLLTPRCIAMLGPDIIIVFAALLMSFPGPSSVRLVLTIGTAIGLFYMTWVLLGQPRSNARELAAELTAEARPSDLIIISPEQVAFSFNRYFRDANEQIDFPEHRRLMMSTYDDWPERVGQRSALDDTFRTLAGAHRSGRRVWLILLDGTYMALPDDDASLPPGTLHTVSIGGARTCQIFTHVARLYGPPVAIRGGGVDPAILRDADLALDQEVEVARLFTAPPTRR
jgi:hypothetical protein